MKKRIFSALLALVLCLGLLPVTASAANANLPDWYFLFAIFKNVDADGKDKNGKTGHAKYTMPQDEIDFTRVRATLFEEYMSQVGVMRAHVDVVEIDTTITKLGDSIYGSWLDAEQATPLLQGKVDLDKYDHVFCVVSLNDLDTSYLGLTGSSFKNKTGHSCINLRSWDYCINVLEDSGKKFPPGAYVHEFLHFAEQLSNKWDGKFKLHDIGDKFYKNHPDPTAAKTDILLNRVKGDAETGTGVHPAVWQYPPRVLRTMTELTVPSSATSIGGRAFWGYTNITRVFIPASVTNIGYATFWDTGVKDVYYAGTEVQWKAIQIGEYNGALTKANIHYNSLMADVKTSAWYAKPVAWALEKGIAAGTGGGNFSPNDTCTQGQILSFLWRANGSPTPAGEVSSSKYYAAAVQWAKEQGLVGVNLNPDSPCTRADVVAYLWQLAGNPKAKAAGFTDVPADAGYAMAVNWAAETGVTSGVSATRFAPDQTCTRSQIVTFLYSALAK